MGRVNLDGFQKIKRRDKKPVGIATEIPTGVCLLSLENKYGFKLDSIRALSIDRPELDHDRSQIFFSEDSPGRVLLG